MSAENYKRKATDLGASPTCKRPRRPTKTSASKPDGKSAKLKAREVDNAINALNNLSDPPKAGSSSNKQQIFVDLTLEDVVPITIDFESSKQGRAFPRNNFLGNLSSQVIDLSLDDDDESINPGPASHSIISRSALQSDIIDLSYDTDSDRDFPVESSSHVIPMSGPIGTGNDSSSALNLHPPIGTSWTLKRKDNPENPGMVDPVADRKISPPAPSCETAENFLKRMFATLVMEPDSSQISTGATELSAENLPTGLLDMINRLPRHYLSNPTLKYVFEGMIEDNMTEDEPEAPKINIVGCKGGPVTPPWEFYYTNRIIYGKGVERWDKNLLQGCDCIGPCDPQSKTCACVKRQTTWACHQVKGFSYENGKLLYPDFPIFECNDACKCPEECVNRVVQNGRKHRISINFKDDHTWGVFAEEYIPRGTYLGIRSGEMLLSTEKDERQELYRRYPFDRTCLFAINFYHIELLNQVSKERKGKEQTYSIDSLHVGNFTRFLRNIPSSRRPNTVTVATYVNEPDVRKAALTIFTSRDVRKGEELTGNLRDCGWRVPVSEMN